MVQYQHLAGNDIDQFKDGKNPIIVGRPSTRTAT